MDYMIHTHELVLLIEKCCWQSKNYMDDWISNVPVTS